MRVVTSIEEGVGGIQAEYVLRNVTFSEVYDVAKYVVTYRAAGGTSGEAATSGLRFSSAVGWAHEPQARRRRSMSRRLDGGYYRAQVPARPVQERILIGRPEVVR